MESSRLPRFKRVLTTPALKLTDRDRAIIPLVYRHRLLRSSQLANLIGGSKQSLLRRLQLLYHHGYLERPRAQIDYYHKGGSRSIVYGLGNKGWVFLKQELGSDFRGIRWGEKNRAIGRGFLEHALLISSVMVALELACSVRGDIKLLTDAELALKETKTKERRPFRWRVKMKNGKSLGVIPDRVFALECDSQNGTTERAYFFLEADRGTMPVSRHNLSQTSFYRKFVAYEATWSQGIHQSSFGFHRFRVVCLTKSAARAKSLSKACEQLKRGHGLFLFADQSILENPAQLLTAAWQTGKPGETTTLTA